MKNIKHKTSNLKLKKIFVVTLLVFILSISLNWVVLAEEEVGNIGKLDKNIGLEEIRIPVFNQITLPNNEYSTALSWASFIGGLFSIGLVIFWIYLLLRASFKMLQSEGNSDGVEDSYAKLKSTFIGAALAIAFPIALSIVGGILGLGPLWSWPAAFRNCPGVGAGRYYFQEVLEQSKNGESGAKERAEGICFR